MAKSFNGRTLLVPLALLASCGGKSHDDDASALGTAGQSSGVAGASSSSPGASAGDASGNQGPAVAVGGRASVGGSAHGGLPASAGGGGVDNAGASPGGASGSGGAASGGVVSGGAAGTGVGSIPSVACSAMCNRYDSGPTGSCEDLGSLGTTCQSECTDLFNAPKGPCAQPALGMLSCLTQTKPSPQLADCWIQFYDVSQQCHVQVNSYEACAETYGGSLQDALCAKISQVMPADPELDRLASCQEDRKCLDGTNYAVRCTDTPEGQSSCSCVLTGGNVTDFTWPDSSVRACKDALSGCQERASTTAP